MFLLSSDYALIQIGGPDKEKFLQGLLTLDVNEIPFVSEKTTRMAAFCNQKGRIKALFRLTKNEACIFLILPRSLLSLIFNELKKYARFSKVEIKIDEGSWQIIGVKEGTSPEYATSQLFITQEIDNEIAGKVNDWNLYEIRKLIPEIYLETSEQFLPHNVNLVNLKAISFNKGCYLGQEIIARMQYLGNIKKRLEHRIIQTEKLPLPGAVLSENEEEIGYVVRVAFNEKQECELLVEVLK